MELNLGALKIGRRMHRLVHLREGVSVFEALPHRTVQLRGDSVRAADVRVFGGLGLFPVGLVLERSLVVRVVFVQ